MNGRSTTNRKNEIVYATLDLAAEKGLGTVSMQQIATKVGITKASLYNHFSSKEEIVEAMYEILRKTSREKVAADPPDYDRLTPDIPLSVILSGAVSSYRNLVNDPEMYRFYKEIMSERPDATLKEICDLVGYASPLTINRAFRKYEGITPSDYRSLLNR